MSFTRRARRTGFAGWSGLVVFCRRGLWGALRIRRRGIFWDAV
jgi:hypothetical protein